MDSTRKGIQYRLYLIMAAIFMVIIIGSTGYFIIFGGRPKFIDCVYMTVISLTTVGYGEVLQVTGNVPAQIFSMLLITFGMGVILYGISTLTALTVEGEVSGMIRRKKMEKKIAKLSHHFIVCGGGETGRHVIRELITNKEKIVLIESDDHRIEVCKEIAPDILYIQGDATEDTVLITAGIKNAAGIIVTLPNDKDNVYVTMTARMLKREIRIIARMVDPKIEPKLRKAGADGVVSPSFIGGLRMASEMIRPTAVTFLDKMLRSKELILRIHEVTISPGSHLSGKTIKESGLKDKYDLLILGFQEKGSQEIKFNPSPDMRLDEGTTLMVMGEVDKIAKARAAA